LLDFLLVFSYLFFSLSLSLFSLSFGCCCVVSLMVVGYNGKKVIRV
jgi:hypothetical protein